MVNCVDHAVLEETFDALLRDQYTVDADVQGRIPNELIPQAIRILDPTAVYFEDGNLVLRFSSGGFGGVYYYGLIVLREPNPNYQLQNHERRKVTDRTLFYGYSS